MVPFKDQIRWLRQLSKDSLYLRPSFYVFSLCLVTVLVFFYYIGQLNLREENQLRVHQNSAMLLSEQIESEVAKRLQIIKTLSCNDHVVEVISGEKGEDNPVINLTLNTANEVAHSELILVLNTKGTVISSTDNKSDSLTGFNYSFRPYFIESMKGRTFVFPAVGAITRTRGLYLSAPITIAGQDKPAGVIALKIGIDQIEEILNRRNDIVALVSPDGIIFSSNQHDWLYHSVVPINTDAEKRLRVTRQFGSNPIKPHWLQLNSGAVTIDGRAYRVVKGTLPIAGWQIYSCHPKYVLSPLPPVNRYILLSALVITGGMSILVFFLATNIRHRRNTEIKLRKAEEKYSSIFKNATMGIFQSTITGQFIEASPSMAEMLGYQDSVQLRQQVTDVGHQLYVRPDDRHRFVDALRHHRTVKGFETQFIRKDQSLIWVSISGRMVSGGSNAEPYLEGFCLDITEKKKAENALLRERDIFSRVMETNPVGIVLLTRNQKISFANSRAEQILDLKKDIANTNRYQKPAWKLADLQGNWLPKDANPVANVMETGQTIRDAHVKVNWPCGTSLILSLNIAPIFDEKHHITEMVIAFEDITDKVKAERNEALRKEQLVLADRMISLGILTSGVAHEINNPNTFILGNAQLFSDAWTQAHIILDEYAEVHGEFQIGGLPYSKFSAKLPLLCERIIEGSRRIKRIVQELRAYSGQGNAISNETLDFNEVIRSARILLSNMIKKSTHHFEEVLGKNLPPIKGNFQRLEQVVINIVQNACQALSDQSLGIFIKTFYDEQTGLIVFTCTDEGIGIPDEHIRHITDPFFTTKRESGGTGLGLSISSNIIREHGGNLSFDTRRGAGTTVTLTLPTSILPTEIQH